MFKREKSMWGRFIRSMPEKKDVRRRVGVALLAAAAFWIGNSECANADPNYADPDIYGTPVNVGSPINTAYRDAIDAVSPDGLTMYIGSDRPGGFGSYDLWVATRATIDDDWGVPVNLGSTVNSSRANFGSSVSADGLTLFYTYDFTGGTYWSADIWVTSRPTVTDPWTFPVNLGWPVNTTGWEARPSISADGLSLFFGRAQDDGSGNCDIWVTTRETTYGSWSVPEKVRPGVNTALDEDWAYISGDGLKLFVSSDRPGGFGGYDLWVTTRAAMDEDWSQLVNLGSNVNSAHSEVSPRLSSDGLTLYFTDQYGTRPGGMGDRDIWQVPVFPEPVCGDDEHPYPIGDLNEDCRVDSLDLAMLCEHWLEDNNP